MKLLEANEFERTAGNGTGCMECYFYRLGGGSSLCLSGSTERLVEELADTLGVCYDDDYVYKLKNKKDGDN